MNLHDLLGYLDPEQQSKITLFNASLLLQELEETMEVLDEEGNEYDEYELLMELYKNFCD
jgi:tRNA U34 5-carboxymethylaminomethyl modifying GTPase MnmE/TrmE